MRPQNLSSNSPRLEQRSRLLEGAQHFRALLIPLDQELLLQVLEHQVDGVCRNAGLFRKLVAPPGPTRLEQELMEDLGRGSPEEAPGATAFHRGSRSVYKEHGVVEFGKGSRRSPR